MRGKAKEEPYRPCHPGITPACAGKRRGSCRRMHRIWDHPRMCGEKASEYTCPLISLGSPPHVRGKACATSRRACAAGITPACAGKSVTYRCYISEGKDHPRMCGEKIHPEECLQELIGSPPHVRGKGPDARLDRSEYRITPACAGKRMHQWCRKIANWDHPRMCGEKPLGLAPAGWPSGSPPHVRGKD